MQQEYKIKEYDELSEEEASYIYSEQREMMDCGNHLLFLSDGQKVCNWYNGNRCDALAYFNRNGYWIPEG